MKKLFLPENRPMLVAVLLIVALLVNGILHYTHPAYRYYREQLQNLRVEYTGKVDAFKEEVQRDILPRWLDTVSNVVVRSSAREMLSRLPLRTRDGVSIVPSAPSVPSLSSLPFGNARFFIVDGRFGVEWQGSSFYVGDPFLGSRITSIDRSCFSLSDGRIFSYNKPNFSLPVKHNNEKTELVKNG